MAKITLQSWSFVHVLETIMELARRGGVDLNNAGRLREATHLAIWGVLDELGRDVKHLGKLTPWYTHIRGLATLAGLGNDSNDTTLTIRAEHAYSLAIESVGRVGNDWLAGRQIANQLVYALAMQLQGDLHADGASERRVRSEKFLLDVYRYGLDCAARAVPSGPNGYVESTEYDPDLANEIAYFERNLGVLFCMRAVAVMAEHPELDHVELVRHGLMKYGVNDVHGRRVCYWCSGCPCVCGGRKSGMKADLPPITSKLVWTRGLPEMDQHMIVYGIGRNSAITALTGVIRSLSEFAEYGWANLLDEHDGNIKNFSETLGCLFLDDTRHVRMSAKKEAEGVPLIASIYSEAADACVSWPCLVTQAVGLDFVRSVKRGLEHMAKGAEVELELPQDLTRTV